MLDISHTFRHFFLIWKSSGKTAVVHIRNPSKDSESFKGFLSRMFDESQ